MHQLTTGFATSRFWMTASISLGLLAGSCGVAAADKVFAPVSVEFKLIQR